MVTEARPLVLYVDDEPTLVFLVTRALEKLGIATQGFTSTQEALAAFGREPQPRASVRCGPPAAALRRSLLPGSRSYVRNPTDCDSALARRCAPA